MAEKRALLVTREQEAALSALLRDYEENLKGIEFASAGGITVERHGKRVSIVGTTPGAGNGGAPSVAISGKITGNASGKAKYTGRSFTNKTSDVLPTGDLAEADMGTLAAKDDCLVLNPPELGLSTTGHDVTAATNTAKFSLYFTGRLVRTNSDGTKVVHAQMFWVGC